MLKSTIKLFFLCNVLIAQGDTEVYLFDLISNANNYSIKNPINISNNDGYDNQPSFMKNGRSILFSSTRNGQTDIVSYNVRNGKKTWLTDTDGSEYSPQQIGNSKTFSAIRLDKDGTQLLYKYSMYSNKSSVLIPKLKVGYYAWANKNQIYCFILGNPPTLEIFDLKTEDKIYIDDQIGRSIHDNNKNNFVSYISKQNKDWTINTVNKKSRETQILTNTLSRSEDLNWITSKTIIMGKENKLYQYELSRNLGWIEIADLSKYGLNKISRIAVSPKKDKVAIVVEEN
mgnify:FL=1